MRRKRAEGSEVSRVLEMLLETSPCPGLVLDRDGIVLLANTAAIELFERSDLVGKPMKLSNGQTELVLESSFGPRHLRLVERRLEGEGAGDRIVWFAPDIQLLETRLAPAEVQVRMAEGEIARLNARETRLHEGQRKAYELLEECQAKAHHFEQLYQQTVHQAIQANTERLAYEDPLTGLPNQAIFRHYLGLSLKEARDQKGAVALLILDLDRFQVVNEILGRAAGDELIRQVAGRLKKELPEKEFLARQRADKFLIVISSSALEGKPSLEVVRSQAEDFCRRSLNALNRSIPVLGNPLHVSASLGISLYPGSIDIDDIFSQASGALYEAKSRGGGDFYFFDPGLRTRMDQRRATLAQLKSGVSAGEFELYYQPIVDLQSGRLAGAEALLRWNHPVRGLLSPADFLELAEDSNLIVPLGSWVLREACRTASVLEDAFVSVNLSARQLLHSHFVEEFDTLLERFTLDPSQLVVEVPERVGIGHHEQLRQTLESLADLGVLLGLDDFGSGSSSLQHLAETRLKFLKIDRAFVNRLPEDKKALSISRSILSLAKSLSTSGLAEGVETLQQVRTLAESGCRYAQGHFFSRAVQLDKLLASRDKRWTV